MRQRSGFLCRGSQTQLFPFAVQGVYIWAWSATEAVECVIWGSHQGPVGLTWSLILTTFFFFFLQCGGCQHWIHHCYRQTEGQVELHKSILDTDSCKYLFLCFSIQGIQIFIQLFYIKVTRKRRLFYVKFWESLCSRGCCVTSVSPLPPEGHCREFLSLSKASWVFLLYWFFWSLKRLR